MTQRDEAGLPLDLLLNRISPRADLKSRIACTGWVDVKIKQAVDLSVRIPKWVQPGQVRVRVNDADRELDINRRYAFVS